MAASTAAERNIALGIGLMLGSVAVFSSTHVLAKWLTSGFPVGELLVFRSLGGLLMLALFLREPAEAGGWSAVIVDRPWLQVLRLLSSTVEVALFYLALSLMPLADAMTFWMSAPIVVAVLSWMLLGERVPVGRWGAVMLGFGGVLLALYHEVQATALGAAVASVGAVTNGLFLTTTRALRRTPDALLVGSQMVGSLTLGLLLTPSGWTQPTATEGMLLLATGMTSTLGHVLLARSMRAAPASVVAPFKYMALVLASFYGWLFFGDVPQPVMAAGGAVIVAAGLWLWWFERREEAA